MAGSTPDSDGLAERAARGPEGEEGIAILGHRQYVGGLWELMGKHQFDYLVNEGLKPSDYLLDIACGSLRGGVHFIRYLEPEHYLGIDKEPELIRLGVSEELGPELFRERRPVLHVSDRFEFKKFTKIPRYALAQSLFTHLSADEIGRCLVSLRDFVDPGCLLYATFFEGDSKGNPTRSHSHAIFFYPSEEIALLGKTRGWKPTYVGDWNHPRRQMMMKFVAV